MPRENSKYEIWQPFLLASMVALGMIIGVKMDGNKLDFIQQVKEENGVGPIGRVEEVVRFIESKYVDSLNSDQILEALISDVMDDLDPHSIYLSADQIRSIEDQMNGNYRGVGVESFFLEDTVRISRVLEGTPAEESGIVPFDKLISIDDSIVAGRGLEYRSIREMLRADEKEEIKLGIKRKNEESLHQILIKPSSVNIQSSKIAYEIADKVAYIKIDRFSSNTYKEFMESLEFLVETKKIAHLIIDLRENPGGYLPETVNILSQLFNEKGRLLVYTQGNNQKKTEYKTTGKNFFEIDKIAVLIDEGSASGSEIIAGALQDWDRALVVGRRSFGKGLVQEQYPLKNGGAIRLTISRYYSPSGRSIQRSYDDLNEYDNDIYHRLETGELYGDGDYILEDTSIYKTQLLDRPMYGGGGIYPDIFVPMDSSYSLRSQNHVLSYAAEYVFWKRDQGKVFSAVTYEDFMNFLGSKGLENTQGLKVNRKKVLQHIQSEFAYQSTGEIARDSILNINDTFIDTALDYISSEKTLLDYNKN